MIRNATLLNMGYGNFPRLSSFLKNLGYQVSIKGITDSFKATDLLIIPGIGNSNIINNINKKTDIYKYILSYKKHQNKILGICLGMQIMCNKSSESKNTVNGLNIFPYNVIKLNDNKKERVPRIGWYESSFTKNKKFNALKLYYAHSYYVDCNTNKNIHMVTKHNNKTIPAIIRDNNIIGLQFHPELSGDNGVEIFQEIMAN